MKYVMVVLLLCSGFWFGVVPRLQVPTIKVAEEESIQSYVVMDRNDSRMLVTCTTGCSASTDYPAVYDTGRKVNEN